VTDHIFVIGAGAATPPFPSSPPNVVFSICGPIATGICNSIDTAHTPVAFGATKPLSNTAVQGKSQATSDAVNTAGNPLAPGRYCFVGSWAGDTNYPQGAADNSDGECFNVTDTSSSSSEQTWLPNDTGHVAATGGSALSGVLSIQLYEGATCADGSEVAGQLYTKTLLNATTLADRSLTTSNTTYTVEASKSVSWKVVFAPTAGSGVDGSDHCESSDLTITN